MYVVVLHDAVDANDKGRNNLRARIASEFKIAPATVEIVFREFPAIVKKGLSANQASILKKKIESIGGIAEIIAADDSSSEAVPQKQTSPAHAMPVSSPQLNSPRPVASAAPMSLQFADEDEPSDSLSDAESEETVYDDHLSHSGYTEENQSLASELVFDDEPEAPAKPVKGEQSLNEVVKMPAKAAKSGMGAAPRVMHSSADRNLPSVQHSSISETISLQKLQASLSGATAAQEESTIRAISIEELEEELEESGLRSTAEIALEELSSENTVAHKLFSSLNSPKGKLLIGFFGVGLVSAVALLITFFPGGSSGVSKSSLILTDIDAMLKEQSNILAAKPGSTTDEQIKSWSAKIEDRNFTSEVSFQTSGNTVKKLQFQVKGTPPSSLTTKQLVAGTVRRPWLNEIIAEFSTDEITIEEIEPGHLFFRALKDARVFLEDDSGKNRLMGKAVIKGTINLKKQTIDGNWSVKHGETSELNNLSGNAAKRLGNNDIAFSYGSSFSISELSGSNQP